MAMDADPWPPQVRLINIGAPEDALRLALSLIGATGSAERPND
jgi:hypothetical protein